MKYSIVQWVLLMVIFPTVGIALDEPMAVHVHGLFIGNNVPGPGQQPLRHAHRDARRIRTAFEELGRWQSTRFQLALNPQKKQLEQALSRAGESLKEHEKMGHKTLFIFYYSGHSKSTGLNLGQEEYSLRRLRQQLDALGATVTLVLLDACQSGAFSGAKGAVPAMDFSSNSRLHLQAEGMAVIASSSETELSQESERLKGSYFTHHFTVGLRGAGDANRDGIVTLDEAYHYAYHRTLSSTALTRVGRQHVVLEMALSGRGGLPLSFPGAFNTVLELPQSLEGEILVQRDRDGVVVAEIRKAAGDQYRVALQPGDYIALVRIPSSPMGFACDVQLRSHRETVLDIEACEPFMLEQSDAKGRGGDEYRIMKPLVVPRTEHVMGEFLLGYFGGINSPYIERLMEFGFEGWDNAGRMTGQVQVVYSPVPMLSIGVSLASMDYRSSTGSLTGEKKTISWGSWRVGGVLRGNLVKKSRLVVPYVQFGGGFAQADYRLSLTTGGGDAQVFDDTFNGFFVEWGAGIQFNPVRWFGITLFQLSYVHAPLVKMTEGLRERHNNGGVSVSSGVRLGY